MRRRAKSLLGLTSTALAVLLIAAAQVNAAFPGQNGKIAYRYNGNIWTVNPDGTGGDRAFPMGSHLRSNPSWAADGQKIAADLYQGCDPQTDHCQYAIATYNADGTDEQVVPLVRGGQMPAWSPGGTRLVDRYQNTPIGSEFDGAMDRKAGRHRKSEIR